MRGLVCVWAILEVALAQVLITIPDYEPDLTLLEGRLSLSCRELASTDTVFNIPSCGASLRAERPAFFQRGVEWPWIGSISWTPESLRFDENQPYNGLWMNLVYSDKSRCVTGSDSFLARQFAGDYCRYMMVCSMVEEFWGKFKNEPSQDLVRLDKYANVVGNWNPVTTPQCLACPVQACKAPNCKNGAVNDRALSLVKNAVIVPPVCGKSCSAGTFLTCKNQPSCEYQPLTGAWNPLQWLQHNVQTVRSDAQLIVPSVAPGVPSLVGDCYPCRFAEGRMHFGTTWSTDPVLYAKGFLGFYCPGASAGPAKCSDADPNMVARVGADGRSGACGCRPGMHYDGGAGRCVPCPPGFFCQWQDGTPPVARECPNGNYSTGGAEACLDCDMSQRCDPGFALTRCVQSGGTGAHQKRNAYCTSCINCKELSGASGTATCYRVAALV